MLRPPIIDLVTGVRDTAFATATAMSAQVNALLVTNNSLYIGGNFNSFNGSSARYLSKAALSTGAVDTTFSQSPGIDSQVYALAADSTNLYVGGAFQGYRQPTLGNMLTPNIITVDLLTGIAP